jgi:hypothetical protein
MESSRLTLNQTVLRLLKLREDREVEKGVNEYEETTQEHCAFNLWCPLVCAEEVGR